MVDISDMPKSLPVGIGWAETFNVDTGTGSGTSVDEQDHQVPFAFTGKIGKLTVKLGPEELTPGERLKIYGAQQTTK